MGVDFADKFEAVSITKRLELQSYIAKRSPTVHNRETTRKAEKRARVGPHTRRCLRLRTFCEKVG